MSDILITAIALRSRLQDGQTLRIFDARHDLMNYSWGHDVYLQGHIPGAIFLDHETELAAEKTGSNGRHPLPNRDEFAALIAQKGVHIDDAVVIYDNDNMMFAAHLWWMLRWLGFENVQILSGGFKAWRAIEGEIETGEAPALAPQQWTPRESLVRLVTVDAVERNLAAPEFTLLDARAPARYRGEEEPMDAVAGHIPGALNRPFALNLDAEGYYKSAEQLREEFSALTSSPEQIVHQCGSGITACHNALAMEIAGLKGSGLYAGSWSEWIADPNRPTVTIEQQD